MRLRQPRRFHQPHRTADLMRLALVFAGEHRGRHQGRRQLDRFHHALARQIAIDPSPVPARAPSAARRAGGDRSALSIRPDARLLSRIVKRAAPVALGAAKSEHRLRGPGRRRRELQRLFGDHDRGDGIVGALRLDEQPAQAQQPRILALGHGAERASARRSRSPSSCADCACSSNASGSSRGMAARRHRHARAAALESPWPIGEQPLRDGMAAARLTPFAAAAPDAARHAPQPPQDATTAESAGNNGDAERQHEYRRARSAARQPPHDNETSPV